MKPQKQHLTNGIIGILDLPEQIFRNIFGYINTHELLSVVRRINRDVKQYVDKYLHLQGVFVVIAEQNVNGCIEKITRLLHIFKREGTKFETNLSISKPFPMFDHSSYMKVQINMCQGCTNMCILIAITLQSFDEDNICANKLHKCPLQRKIFI